MGNFVERARRVWRRSEQALPVYFLHIPKTAGTSVTAWLARQVDDDALCPARIWDELAKLKREKLSSYHAFSGHFGVDLEEFLGFELMSACVFRDPVARTRSHYRHVFHGSGHPRHAYVSRQSFQTFVRDENNWPMIENFQARYLVRTPLHLRSLCERLDFSPPKQSRLSVLSKDARYLLDTAYVRDRSFQMLDKLRVVGVTDNLATFLDRLARQASFAAVGDRAVVPQENTTTTQAGDDPVDERTMDTLRMLTRVDQSLYEAACLGTR